MAARETQTRKRRAANRAPASRGRAAENGPVEIKKKDVTVRFLLNDTGETRREYRLSYPTFPTTERDCLYHIYLQHNAPQTFRLSSSQTAARGPRIPREQRVRFTEELYYVLAGDNKGVLCGRG